MDITTAPTQITPAKAGPTPEYAARLADAYRRLADWVEDHPIAAAAICDDLDRGAIVRGSAGIFDDWSTLVSSLGPFKKELNEYHAAAIVDVGDGFNIRFMTGRSTVCEVVDTGEVEEVDVEVEVKPAVTRTEKQTRPVMEYRCGSWLDNEAEQ